MPDALNRYASVAGTTFAYDGRGNLQSDGTRTFSYDVENRLLTVVGGAGLTLAYDPLGRLWQTTSGSTVTQFLYDGDRLVGEYGTTGTASLRRYVHGPGVDDPVLWYEGSGVTDRRWIHADERGSVIATTDGTGAATIYTYGPYGEPPSWTGSRFRYTGQIALPEAQLYHYKARVYDPVLGRFLQTDPIGSKDDLDLYTYTGNDPLDKTDPSGQCPWCLVGAIAGAGVSAIVQYSTTGDVDIQQVRIAAAAGFISGGASTVIAAAGALSARIALNVAAGAAIGGAQSAASKVAATGSAPSVSDVAEGAKAGAIGAGIGAAVGEAVTANAANAAGFIGASSSSSAATKSLAGTVKQATMSALSDAQKSSVKAAPSIGTAAGVAAQSGSDIAKGTGTATTCANTAPGCK